jgi:hypothetical protein
VYRYPNYHSRRASNSLDVTDVAFECFCCGSTEYFISDYEFREATKEFARNLRLKKEKEIRRAAKAKKNTSRRPSDKKSLRQKKHGHAVVYDSNSNATSSSDTNLEQKDSDNNSTKLKLEKVILLKELIRKSTPYT